MYNDGYKYWCAYKKSNISYYRCCRYKNKCPGRCVVEGDRIRSTTAHNHEPEPDKVIVDKFRKILTHRAATETTDLYTIFWDEATQRHADAALLYTFASAESAMRKARRKQLPPTPNTIYELGELLSASELFRIHSGHNKHPFYQTTLKLEDSTCLIFFHQKTLEQLGRIDEMHVDVTFEIKPITSPSYCLLTAHSVQSYTNTPFLYSIMTAKTHAAYAAIFAYMRENYLSFISPNVIISSYDIDIQSALSLTFPEATIKGFWSQYTNAILRQTKNLELQRETARGHGSSFLRMLLVLPLLPAEYMAPGMECLRKWAQEKKILNQQLIELCTYVEQNWVRAVGAGKMSIFGLPHSIYNHVQYFNQELENSLGVQNPMIWQMLESLTSIATRTYVKVCKRIKLMNTTGIKPKKGQQTIDTIIKNATQFWIRSPVHLRNPLHFLQMSSHCINDTIYYSTLEDLKSLRKDSSSSSLQSQSSFSTLSLVSNNNNCNISGGNILGTVSLPTTNFASLSGQSYKVLARASTSLHVQSKEKRIKSITPLTQQMPHTVQATGTEVIHRSDPPPLAFFPKNSIQKKFVYSSEPPPLVPISAKK